MSSESNFAVLKLEHVTYYQDLCCSFANDLIINALLHKIQLQHHIKPFPWRYMNVMTQITGNATVQPFV